MENRKKNGKKRKVFRLVIFDEVSLKEKFNITLTKANIFTYGGALIIIIGVLISLLFIFTPLKFILPPVDNYKLKNKIVKNTILIDSLEKEIQFRDKYFEQVRNIINGNDVKKYSYTDSSMTDNLLTQRQKDSILEQLLQRDEQELEEIRQSDISNFSGDKFHKPAEGVVSNEFKPAEGHYGIDIAAKENDPVVATLPGTIVLATWSVNTGYVVQIQHSNNLITVYKHNSELLKKEGDRVKAGEPIALVGNTGEHTSGSHLHFEIWQNGNPVNPKNFINF